MNGKTEKARKPAPKQDFLYTEECGLALMKNRRTGKKLCMDKNMWDDIVTSILEQRHPGVIHSGDH